MTDATTAPEWIKFWEDLRTSLSANTDEVAMLVRTGSAGADRMGDFAIGEEPEVVAELDAIGQAIVRGLERLDTYIANLHREYDASTEAAVGKKAAAHDPMRAA